MMQNWRAWRHMALDRSHGQSAPLAGAGLAASVPAGPMRARVPRLWQTRTAPAARRTIACALLVATAAALAAVVPGVVPVPQPAYTPLALALVVGALLTVRVAPGARAGTLLLGPLLVAYTRFGAAALPALVFAVLVAGLVRRAHPTGILASTAQDAIAFLLAHAAASLVAPSETPRAILFTLAFVALRVAIWRIAARIAVPPADDARVEQPDVILSLALAPLAALPLWVWPRLGDGGLLLTVAALLALLFVVREATNLATARAEAETARDQLARTNALQDELIHLMTHDLKNPLTTVRVYTQLGEKAATDRVYDRLPQYFANIDRGARAIERLIENLLQLSLIEQSAELPPPEAVDVEALTLEVFTDLATLADRKRIALATDIRAGARGVSAWAPPVLLREAVSNLVSNAVKYTPEGGSVTVWLDAGSRPDTIELGVSDSGIGLSSDDLKKLFTKFFRSANPLARQERGTGLGLALTHAVIRRIGGDIEVESELGHGTTFRLLLPTKPAAGDGQGT